MANPSIELNNLNLLSGASGYAPSDNRQPKRIESLQEAIHLLFRPVIHDLKLPLHAEKRALELVRTGLGAIPKEVQTLLACMQKNNQDLLSMVEQLLEASNHLHVQAAPTEPGAQTHLPKLLQELCLQLSPLAELKHITLQTQVPDNLPPLPVHPTHMRRILANLAGNAIQHTPYGTRVQIHARLRHQTLHICVQDTGRLMTHAETPVSIYQQSGLGLSVCRMLLNAYGGSIRLDTRYKAGARFLIRIPLP